ncbi:MAG TPA: BBE domain-containing protein [Mycobacterium sp.]|nr:BBE domain-containing protein [Mycobacterium sp.]
MANTPSSYFCLSFGGAVRNDPPGGSAFPHRDALFYCEPAAASDWETQYYGSHRERLRRVKAT